MPSALLLRIRFADTMSVTITMKSIPRMMSQRLRERDKAMIKPDLFDIKIIK
jgi:hypothetical protein